MSLRDIRLIQAEDTWLIRQQVMWPDRDLDYIKLPKDSEGLHYGFFVEQKLTSVISLFVEEKQAQFRKFATLQSAQGKGYGSKLLNFTIQKVVEHQVNRIWCNARTDKVHFYRRFGMIETGKTFIKGGVSYEIMERQLT